MKEKDIILVRRDTGGVGNVDNGASTGVLNVGILTYTEITKILSTSSRRTPQLRAAEAEQRGRNDLTARGKKQVELR